MSNVDASAVASVLGTSVEYVNLRGGQVLFLPQRIAIIALGHRDIDYSIEKRQITSATQAGQIYGWGSPIHLIALELLPPNGDGVGTIPVTVYPLAQGYEATESEGTITPVAPPNEAVELRVRVSGIPSAPFVVEPGDSVAVRCGKIAAAINAVLKMPVVADDNTTAVGCEVKWLGPSANDVFIEIIGDLDGATFTIVQPTGGLVNPSVDDALAQIGNTWETLVLNQLGTGDSDALDALQDFGEGRYSDPTQRPFIAFAGNTDVEVDDATAVSETRTDDRVNGQLVAPGSPNLPFVVAARQLARIAVIANENPPQPYRGARATGLVAGTDAEQWNYTSRDQAVKAGSSTIEVNDGVVNLCDVVTFYAPEGEEPPAYRHVVDLVKVHNIIFNTNLLFATDEWKQAILIPDEQETVNPKAKHPSDAVTAMNKLIDSLALWAILSDPKTAKKNTTAKINSQNPNRLDLKSRLQISGHAGIINVELQWGFYFAAA